MEPMHALPTHNEHPPGYLHLTTLLPCLIQISLFANIITLLITLGSYGPTQRFFHSFEVFIALAWFFFLTTLTLSLLIQSILVYQRAHVVDAFGRGRGGYSKWRDGRTRSLGERLAVGLVVKVPCVWVLEVLLLMGFLFCALCVVAHQVAVGWLGFVWVILMMILATVFWILQDHV